MKEFNPPNMFFSHNCDICSKRIYLANDTARLKSQLYHTDCFSNRLRDVWKSEIKFFLIHKAEDVALLNLKGLPDAYLEGMKDALIMCEQRVFGDIKDGVMSVKGFLEGEGE